MGEHGRRGLLPATVAVLLAAGALQQITSAPHASAVVDEPAHLTAGYLSLVRGDLAFNREHPPLMKALAALPLLAMRPVLPPDDPHGPPHGTEDYEFDYSRKFLYHANDADRLLAAARVPVIVLTAALGFLIFLWARAVAGAAGGLAALALYVFEPNLLAHGRLVTTDMGAAAFTIGFLWFLRRASRSGRSSDAAVAAAMLGCALLSKFSTLLLLPLAPLLVLLDRALASPGERIAMKRLVAMALIVAAGAWLLLEAGYLFGGFPLPRLYTDGLALARAKNAQYEGPTYLCGEISKDGFLSYFLTALGVKTPIPLLILSLLGAGALLVVRAARREAIWVLVPAAAWLGAMSILTRAQIGFRYVLPVTPLLCIAGGAAVAALLGFRRRAAGSSPRPSLPATMAVGALLFWQGAAAVWIWPYHLAYFNEAAGGPDKGWRWLADSNLDWGQDLAGLQKWLLARGNPPVNLYYFGTADPDFYGIQRVPPDAPRPGIFAVSATHLTGVYLPDPGYLAEFRSVRPAATIGHSILIFDIPEVPPRLREPLRRASLSPPAER